MCYKLFLYCIFFCFIDILKNYFFSLKLTVSKTKRLKEYFFVFILQNAFKSQHYHADFVLNFRVSFYFLKS